ncbi:hypothetical protein F2Q69_00012164 [Brassica cretica]|uniref:Uncharacterized protein n=1 Tax=Brassica cretica TaxID=69181 RepID=A0A8S9QYS9_BRACR|nr:hypothetical protein F2Q69_00012164 [Brassica cretica]
MTIDDRQTRADDGDTHDNVDKTSAANVSAVNANSNTAAFEGMFTAFKKTTKLHGRRLDFATPSGRIANTRDKSSGQAPNETAPAAAQKDSENLPLRGQEAENDEIE